MGFFDWLDKVGFSNIFFHKVCDVKRKTPYYTIKGGKYVRIMKKDYPCYRI